jgi:hypothetical protein
MTRFMLGFLMLMVSVSWAEEVPVADTQVSEASALPPDMPRTVAPAAPTAPQVPASVEPPQPVVPTIETSKGLLNQTWESKYADQPYIALVSDYETTIKPDWSYEETYHARIKIQKDEAKELGQWPIYYNKSRDSITDIQAHVENPDGHIYRTADVQDLPVYDDVPMYSDMRMKVVTLPNVGVGSIIEVSVKSTTTHKEIPDHFWGEILYPAIPTKHSKHTFIIPDDKFVQLKNYKNDYSPLIDKSGGKTTYTFTFEETAPIPEDEELMPPLQEVLGAIYLSSLHDWKEVADWYRDAVRQKIIDDPEITVRTLELVKGKKTQQEKARAILEFIQDNFRVIPLNFGDNATDLHPSVETMRNRYGDTKDLALLAKQMLKLAGIEANSCLFSSEYAGDPQNGLPSPSVFSSVMLQLTLDGQPYYVDPVLKGYDFGHLPSHYDNGTVLVISDTGDSFDHLPVGSAQEHALISEADVTIDAAGSAEYRVHVKLPAETSQSFKNTWSTSTTEDKDKFFLNLEKNFAKEGKILDRQITGLEDRYAQVEISFRYQAVHAYPIVNDMILIKEESQADLPDFVSETRRHIIFLPNNSLIKNTNTYHIPEGFKMGSMPASFSLSIDLMDASVTYQQKENTVQVDTAYATKRCSIPLDRYNQVRDFRKELDKKDNQYVVLKKTSDLSPEAKDFIKKQ